MSPSYALVCVWQQLFPPGRKFFPFPSTSAPHSEAPASTQAIPEMHLDNSAGRMKHYRPKEACEYEKLILRVTD